MRISTLWALLVCMAVALYACAPTEPDTADLVLTNGKIVTVDGAIPEAEAIAYVVIQSWH